MHMLKQAWLASSMSCWQACEIDFTSNMLSHSRSTVACTQGGGQAAVAELGGSVITGIDGNPLAVLARQLHVPLYNIETEHVPIFMDDGMPADARLDNQVLAEVEQLGLCHATPLYLYDNSWSGFLGSGDRTSSSGADQHVHENEWEAALEINKERLYACRHACCIRNATAQVEDEHNAALDACNELRDRMGDVAECVSLATGYHSMCAKGVLARADAAGESNREIVCVTLRSSYSLLCASFSLKLKPFRVLHTCSNNP